MHLMKLPDHLARCPAGLRRAGCGEGVHGPPPLSPCPPRRSGLCLRRPPMNGVVPQFGEVAEPLPSPRIFGELAVGAGKPRGHVPLLAQPEIGVLSVYELPQPTIDMPVCEAVNVALKHRHRQDDTDRSVAHHSGYRRAPFGLGRLQEEPGRADVFQRGQRWLPLHSEPHPLTIVALHCPHLDVPTAANSRGGHADRFGLVPSLPSWQRRVGPGRARALTYGPG